MEPWAVDVEDAFYIAQTFNGHHIVGSSGIGDAHGWLQLYKVSSGALVKGITCSPRSKIAIGDGFILALNNEEVFGGRHAQVVRIHDEETLSPLQSLAGHGGDILCLAISKDSQIIVSGGFDCTVRIWKKSGPKFSSFQVLHDTNVICAVAISHDSGVLAVGSMDKSIKTFNMANNFSHMQTLLGHEAHPSELCFSPRLGYLCSCSADETIRIWNPTDGRNAMVNKAHSDPINSVDFSPGGGLIASCSDDGTLKIWSARTLKLLHTIDFGYNIRSQMVNVKFSTCGRFVITTHFDKAFAVRMTPGYKFYERVVVPMIIMLRKTRPEMHKDKGLPNFQSALHTLSYFLTRGFGKLFAKVMSYTVSGQHFEHSLSRHQGVEVEANATMFAINRSQQKTITALQGTIKELRRSISTLTKTNSAQQELISKLSKNQENSQT